MNQLTRIWNSLSITQRISLFVVPLVLIGAAFSFLRWKHESGFRTLYSGLAPEDAAAVTTKMREAGIEYRLDETGASILVPNERLAEARLALAGAGMPRSGRIGFELFDRSNLGASDFAEQVNYQRALEGELERTVALLSDVESARIHLTFARESVFLDTRQPGKATVVLRLKRPGQISGSSVAAVANLVASAVEGLSPESVSNIDGNGRLLNRPRSSDTGEARTAAADLGYRQSLESDMLQRINSSLEPLLGAGKFRAGVSIDCDFTATDENEEVWDSTKSAVLTSQTTEESNGSTTAAGVPGTLSNLPRPPARSAGSGSGLTRRTENVSYQPGHLVRHTVAPRGAVRKVYASVLVDQTVRWEGTGAKAARILVPPPAEVLKGVRDIVASIAGYDEKRGDQLTVETLPFETTLTVEAPGPALKPVAPVPGFDLKQPTVIGGVALAVLLASVAFLLLRRGGSKKKLAEITAPAEIAAARGHGSGTVDSAALSTIAGSAADTGKSVSGGAVAGHIALPAATSATETLSNNIRAQIEQDASVAANILRSWINESGGGESR